MNNELIITTAMKNLKDSITQLQEKLKINLAGIAAGRAHPDMLRSVKIEGASLAGLASTKLIDSLTLEITPFDRSNLGAIITALNESPMGLTVHSEVKSVFVKVPSLTEDRKKQLVKAVQQIGEDAKTEIRKFRNDANTKVKQITAKDEQERGLKLITKIFDDLQKELEEIIEKKKKELLS